MSSQQIWGKGEKGEDMAGQGGKSGILAWRLVTLGPAWQRNMSFS